MKKTFAWVQTKRGKVIKVFSPRKYALGNALMFAKKYKQKTGKTVYARWNWE